MRIKEGARTYGLGVGFANNVEITMNRRNRYGNTGMQLLKEKGMEFVHGNEKADVGISNHGARVKGLLRSQCILLRMEPPIYNIFWGRNINKRRYMKKYKATLSAQDLYDDSYHYLYPSFKCELINEYLDRRKDNLLCMILKNKNITIFLNNFFPSLRKYNKHSNMKIRVEADKTFCNLLGRNKYHSYGRGWDERCFRGSPPGKNLYDIISRHKFVFCPENSSFDGYITEKPIDAMCCGSVPIYLGAPDVDKYLPKGTFIDYRYFTPEELVEYIKTMSDKTYEVYQKNIKKFIESKKIDKFSSVAFAKKLIKVIEEKVE